MPLTPALATSVPLGQPTSAPQNVAVDGYGNLYLTAYNCVFKVDAAGVLTRVAGRSTEAGYLGDGGLAIDAQFNNLTGIAADGTGNIYISDAGNFRIRKISVATGVVTTAAGNGTQGYSGDGGIAVNAQIDADSIALDSAGNLFIMDGGNFRIRKVAAATGVITTVAGNGSDEFSGDGGLATSAGFSDPGDLAVDGAGNIYIIDQYRIRKVSAATGIITTVAGNGTNGYSGENGPAIGAQMGIAFGLTADSAGNLYIADTSNYRVRKVTAATGIISTVSGDGVGNYSGDGGAATNAQLSFPTGVVVDGPGNLYIADTHQVRKVSGATGIITTIAGSGAASYSGDGSQASIAQLAFPSSVALDRSGNLYIADLSNQSIRKLAMATGIITTAVGNGAFGYSGDGGPATSAQLGDPGSVAVDGSGNLFIADTYNCRIRMVAAASGVITTVAGDGARGYSGDDGPATSAQLSDPSSVTLDGSGNLFIADASNDRIRKLALATGIITTVAGNGTSGYSGDGGPATSAQLSGPSGVAADGLGNLYIADTSNNLIRKVVLATGIITTVAGDGTCCSSGDGGPALSAQLGFPAGVGVDRTNFYIADSGSGQVRQVALATGIITTAAGNGNGGYSGDGGPAGNAELASPQGVTADSAGNLYVADTNNGVIRMLAPSGGSPMLSVTESHAAIFTAGQNGAAYSILISNASGAGPANGAVTVSENIPAGLTLQAISGIGWNCPLSANTCTRSDALNGGASYPPITVSVNIPSNAPVQVINKVTVTGGRSVAAATSDGTTIVGNPAKLALPWQPSVGVVGSVLLPVVVQVQDGNGNVVAGSTALITVTSNPAGVNATINAVNGLATFSNLVFNSAGSYMLTATTSGLPSATSNQFRILGPPSVFIDTPGAGAVVTSGTVTISGWAIDNTSLIGSAISSVLVSVDGFSAGTASYGIVRADVCAVFPARPGCPNVGFAYLLNTAVLSNGNHTVAVSVTDSDGTPDSSSVAIGITVSNSVAASPPSVFIDAPLAGAVVASGMVAISGWAVDNTSSVGTAIASVVVKVDGTIAGTATYGISRPDVCAVFPGRLNCPRVGYSYSLDTRTLSTGLHTITVSAADSDGVPDVGNASIAIAVSNAPPAVYIDSPTPGSVLSGVVTVAGWAIDSSASGTAIAGVQVNVDGVLMGTATYGGARPDVCAAYPARPGCPNVGFTYQLNTGLLSVGPHTISVVAMDGDGNPDTGSTPVSVTVIAPAPIIYVDSPAPDATISGSVTVSGWAIDNATAIDSVQVKVDGNAIGNAAYGSARPDVCVAFPGRQGCPNVGFTYILDTTKLAAGLHTLTLVAMDTDVNPDFALWSEPIQIVTK